MKSVGDEKLAAVNIQKHFFQEICCAWEQKTRGNARVLEKQDEERIFFFLKMREIPA